jgi:hypothetical protein
MMEFPGSWLASEDPKGLMLPYPPSRPRMARTRGYATDPTNLGWTTDAVEMADHGHLVISQSQSQSVKP